jgi:phage-related protein
MKEVLFHIKAKETVKGFSSSAKDDIGSLLRRLQDGEILKFPDSRPMPDVERGAYELRVRDADGIYRVFYYLKSAKGILVFHAFTKKTQTTPQREIELGRKRLWEMLNR